MVSLTYFKVIFVRNICKIQQQTRKSNLHTSDSSVKFINVEKYKLTELVQTGSE